MTTMPTHSTSLRIGDRPVELEENLGSRLQAVIIFLITTLGGYIQFQYQIQKKSLIEEHKNIMVAILVNLSMYALGCMAEYNLRNRTNDFRLRIIKRFSPLFGILVVVLLLIILLPLLGIVAIILWALFMLQALIKSVQETLEWLRQVNLRIRDIIRNYFGSGGSGSDTMTEENRSTGGEGIESLAV